MNRFAEIYAGVNTAIFIWSMGLTQHRFGVENVEGAHQHRSCARYDRTS